MQIHLAAQPAVLVPHIGGDILAALDKLLHLIGRSVIIAADGLVELIDREAGAVTLGKSDAVVLNVIPAAAFDLCDFVGGAGKVRDHGAPIEVAVADTGECAAAFLGELIELCGESGGGVPRIEGFLAGGDGVDAVLCADGEDILQLRDGAARGDDAHIGLELTDALVRVGGVLDRDADEGITVAYNLGDILADVGLVAAESADQLTAVLKHITHEIAAHLTCTVLNDFDFAIHIIASSNCL